MKKSASGSKTMLMSVLMSAPGPLIIALGLLAGRSSTQLADFVRRSAELLALVAAYVVYRRTCTLGDDVLQQKVRMERRSNLFVGLMMCLSGLLMMLTTFLASSADKGNVIPGLAVALLGVIANTLFWRKYTRLSHEEDNAILPVQARLYRAKALVDLCVTAALTAVLLLPGTQAASVLDMAGSLAVELYLMYCGAKTVREAVGR